MLVLAGLGNPGAGYAGHRHNMGFMAVDAIASGRLDPSSLYTHSFSLDRLGEALDATRDRPDGFLKALVTY